MARRRQKKTSFWNVKQGFKNVGGGIWQAGKEYSSIAAYASRQLTGQPPRHKVKCKLKKGWFE